MRLLGIDYGSKRIGVAVSDENANFTFPHSVVENNKNTMEEIKKICGEKNIGKIILGESVDYKGRPNLVMKKIEIFKRALEKEIGLLVIYQTETLTTAESLRLPDRKTTGRGIANLKRRNSSKMPKNDASAAALILRSFIESKKVV